MAKFKPHKYQDRGAEFWLKNPRAYYAVDMGMGKTLMTLLALSKIKKPTLIIGPLKTIYNTWPTENVKWGFNFKMQIVHGPQKHYQIRKKADVYVSN